MQYPLITIFLFFNFYFFGGVYFVFGVTIEHLLKIHSLLDSSHNATSPAMRDKWDLNGFIGI